MRFLDTNTCIMHWRKRHPNLSRRWAELPAGELAIPLPVFAELLVGAEKSSQPERVLAQIERLITAHDVIDLTEEVAEQYARIRANLERRGMMIGNNDLWIAASALAYGATLVTNDVDEFSRVPGLKIEDWSKL